MKIIAFALCCVLFGSFGNYPPPAEEMPLSVISKITSSIIRKNAERMRPGFAKRERHRAIRSKSSPPAGESGLSAPIPGRVYPLPVTSHFANATTLFSRKEQKQKQEHHTPRPVSSQTETQTVTNTNSVTAEICLSSEEKKLYDLIMAYRKSKRLAPIPYSAKLSKVAQAHVRDLETNYNYENASTCNPHSWSDKGTWRSCCYTSDHKQASCMWTKPEEIAGYEGAGYEIAYYSSAGANATEGLEGWKKSPGHNPLIINSGTWSKMKWQAIGIGIYGQYGAVWFGEEADESKMKVCK